MPVRRVAVITGAASGIGRACVELFTARDCAVVAVDLPGADFGWLADDAPVEVVRGDVADELVAEEMVAAALDRWGRLDVAVLNAGVVGGPGFEESGALDRLDRVLAVNVRAVAAGIAHAAPALRRTGEAPAIVATASTSGLGGDPRNFAYTASKAAVMNLVRAAAMDYGVQLSVQANEPSDGKILPPDGPL